MDLPDLPDLPVRAALGEIASTLAAHGTAVLVAPPGTGKTTLVPLALAGLDGGRILVAEPRRLAARAAAGEIDPAAITPQHIEAELDTADLPPLDLVIRSSGEQRLSNFLLWQAAYAELVFCDKFWPEFLPADFDAAVAEFARRSRRFGS